MRLERFDPPGLVEEFDEEQRAAWSEFISDQFDRAAAGRPDEFDFDGPRAQFYNPMKKDTEDADAARPPAVIRWTAFPRNVEVGSVSDLQRWRRADGSRDLQDEYCEWSVERDPESDKITRVTFTCEAPEYWQFLARSAPDTVLRLYREFVNPAVEARDLFDARGRYEPRNRWNNNTQTGAMHLIQRNNTLSAEIELAGGSSVVRAIDGRVLDNEQELIRCGQYGDTERHSDPHIGAEVNALTRQKADVTLANPVGLYIDDLNTSGWQTPDGSDPKSFWRILRGAENTPVRAVYEVPADRGFTVGDITIAGRQIRYGAQIVDYITIKLMGVATRIGQSTVAPMTGCLRPRQAAQARELQPAGLSVQDALAAPSVSARRR